jgi:hypothetical protein
MPRSKKRTPNENGFRASVLATPAAHWLLMDKEQRGPFSMVELKTYYHNLMLVERFSIALNLNPTEIENNPKIKELLFSNTYVQMAA